ncbi:11647_t:CDS:2 [Scutellospora calospora]|uniref:11647_t:CDS:1 n=1 Tax=Scutellospora calospora TaxID=85575 RepID=A0ACA9JUC9_9GLOM|nr:11647_t:CDS:2 [Scutellospora calospora]
MYSASNNHDSFTAINCWNASTSDIEWEDPDKTYVCLDSDFSLMTNSTKASSTISDDNYNDIHELSFNYDYNTFQKAQEAACFFENNDNTDFDDEYDKITSSDTDYLFADSIESSNIQEDDYIIQDISCKKLGQCVVLDIYNGEVKRCPNYERPRHLLRPLHQLVGTWEINSSVIDKNNPRALPLSEIMTKNNNQNDTDESVPSMMAIKTAM